MMYVFQVARQICTRLLLIYMYAFYIKNSKFVQNVLNKTYPFLTYMYTNYTKTIINYI